MNLVRINNETMTSLEIATITDKRHDHVIRDIKNMESAYTEVFINAPKFGLVNYKAGNGEMRPMFSLTKSQALFVVSGYSAVIRARIQHRWEVLELKYLNEQTRLASRATARLENPEMTKALTNVRKEHGKETKAHHYSNENNLIYRIVLGSTAKKYKEVCGLEKNESLRDYLEPLQIDAIQQIQKMNTSLIALDFDYAERKTRLNTYFMKHLNDDCCKELCKTFE